MALFKIDKKTMSLVKTTNFQIEKELQTLIENNLETVFNCRFVASEFSTGVEHAGRIDTLALSEDNNPVIIEYKKVKSSELINQSLYYLSWIQDHRGDFQLAVDKTLETGIEVDWNDIRVICLAPGYKKYDLLAVKMMGANIELWQYKLFDNNTLLLQEIFRRGIRYSSDTAFDDGKSPEFIEEGRMAAVTRATRQYTFDEHLENVEKKTLELIHDLREFIVGLDDSVEEVPKKFYVAYKVTQNFVCMQTSRNKVTLFLKLDPKEFEKMPDNARDVTEIGHYGTGKFEYVVKRQEDLEEAKKYIRMAFERIGG